MDLYQEYIHKSRYARWLPEESRRETWDETVSRYINFFASKYDILDSTDYSVELFNAIYNLEVMPSMRCLMTAGKALDRDNMAGFNCAFIAIDDHRAFCEVLYVLMCGTGVGFSVERQYINQLPEVSHDFFETDTTISVPDSKVGWAKSFKELVAMLYSGQVPQYDLSKLRPAGAPLKTFGGRSSGPEPLRQLFDFTIRLFRNAAGRKLTSIECHDLVCKIADIVVVGGVRRSALISLSNLSDDRMRNAKQGQWWEDHPQRALANNSAVYAEQPEFATFLNEIKALYDSKAGERGIFSRAASVKQAARSGRRDTDHAFGTNPCSEIILRSCQVCNLSEVVVRPTDTLEDLERKVRQTTILGTLQSTLTNFRFVRPIWERNTAEESLLGVSFTGIMDHPILSGREEGGTWFDHPNMPKSLPEILEHLKGISIETNKEWAERLGVNPSTAITCVKPSGTVSQLVDSASGIHARFSDYYIRRVRNDKKDPLTNFLLDQGVPGEVDVMNSENVVFSFPVKSPEGVRANELDIRSQLDLWETYQDHWCEHKPSVTIYYDDTEFLVGMQWLWDNMDKCSGISFLPKSDHIYAQAPYEAIDKDTYETLKAEMPDSLNWEELSVYEAEDMTVGSQELACHGTSCEL